MFAFNPAARSGGSISLDLTGPSPSCRRLVVILVRPSRYDDEGYVIRHLRGMLPSNTLSCLNSLTEDAVRQGALGDVDVHVEVIDEIVTRVDPARLGAAIPARRTRRSSSASSACRPTSSPGRTTWPGSSRPRASR